MKQLLDTYVFTETIGGKEKKFVLYREVVHSDGFEPGLIGAAFERIAGYVGNVDESPLEEPVWKFGNYVNIGSPNIVGKLVVTELLHNGRLACVASNGALEIHAKPIDKPPSEQWETWKSAGSEVKRRGDGFYYRMEINGNAYEFGAPTFIGLLQLMHAKGIEIPNAPYTTEDAPAHIVEGTQ